VTKRQTSLTQKLMCFAGAEPSSPPAKAKKAQYMVNGCKIFVDAASHKVAAPKHTTVAAYPGLVCEITAHTVSVEVAGLPVKDFSTTTGRADGKVTTKWYFAKK